MLLRDVLEEEVRKTVDEPTAIFLKRSDNTQEFRREDGKRNNFVVVEYIKKGYVKVITTGWV